MQKSRSLRHLHVHKSPLRQSLGWLVVGQSRFRCALGRSGIGTLKKEGDGKTPRGQWPLRRAFYRADRLARPLSLRPTHAIKADDAWCDDTHDRRYNRLIKRPVGTAEECLMRQDPLYDVIIELGYNDAPVKKAKGSAIFFHVARDGFKPTAGCVAIERQHFSKILPRLSRHCVMVIR